jgi:8-oxo-dGTP diphosphatase
VKHKVYAYITHARSLLLFRHPDAPEAGVQVPGGTIEPGEDPAAAVLREAFEETGLENLRLSSFLGETLYEYPGETEVNLIHRRYYHLARDEPPPATWRHFEKDPAEGDETEVAFDFFWVDIDEAVPALIANLDELIDLLRAALEE